MRGPKVVWPVKTVSRQEVEEKWPSKPDEIKAPRDIASGVPFENVAFDRHGDQTTAALSTPGRKRDALTKAIYEITSAVERLTEVGFATDEIDTVFDLVRMVVR